MNHAPAMMTWMQALSDMTRARLLRLLEGTELTVVEMCAVLQSPQSTVSRHLKVLGEDRWLESRRDGTSRYYRMPLDGLEPPRRRLWTLVRDQASETPAAAQDDRRLEQVLADRRSRSQAFFSTAAGQWDRLRTDLFGARVDMWAVAGLLDPDDVIGDLGCGTASLSASIAPFVERVIAVDSSAAMLRSARSRLKKCPNIDLRRGELNDLPLQDQELDSALMVLVLPYLAEPLPALAEAARTIKPGGRLVIVDMQPHERQDYRQDMGHVWLGFSRQQIESWFSELHFTKVRWHAIPPDSQAKGPDLFVAAAIK
ncbi:MAG TPA: metalloregulator ArsR/SmtB family transcription factor [Planctomycetes bacterium]|nr:metalloregulator ArsR/SmtB family transcription factor [Planctomycetota bacterium]